MTDRQFSPGFTKITKLNQELVEKGVFQQLHGFLFFPLEIKIIKSLDLFVFLFFIYFHLFIELERTGTEHGKFDSCLSPVGLEPRKATSLTPLPLVGAEVKMAFFP